MRILVIGQGGREHALAWRIAQDDCVRQVFVAPGNGGTESAKVTNVAAGSMAQWLAAARELEIDLAVIGPEAPLVAGIADAFAAAGVLALGPGASGARLEKSKSYAKERMLEWGLPTAAHFAVADLDQARDCFKRFAPPYVIKADGLAGGKGVKIAANAKEAMRVTASYLAGEHGGASRKVVIEEFLAGTEMSLMALCDGSKALVLASSQDYKRLEDGDKGPNTGGMGACSPAKAVGQGLVDNQLLLEQILQPILDGMAAQGKAYRGFLYAGLMISDSGEARVLELNCRLGDPEAQVVLPLCVGEITPALLAAARGSLEEGMIGVAAKSAVGVVLAAEGYPRQPRTGEPITMPETDKGDFVFHAGTKLDAGSNLAVSGGRVACATAVRDDLGTAHEAAYALAAKVEFNGRHFRHDVAVFPG